MDRGRGQRRSRGGEVETAIFGAKASMASKPLSDQAILDQRKAHILSYLQENVSDQDEAGEETANNILLV